MAAVGLCNLMAQERGGSSSSVPLLVRGARPKFWIYCPKPRATPRRRRFRTTVTPTRSACAVYGPRQAASPNWRLSGRGDGYGRGLEAATRGPNPARPGSAGARRVVGPEVARVRTRRRSPRATGRRSCAHRRSVRRSCAHRTVVTGFHRAATMDNKAWTQGYERVDDALVNAGDARSVPRHVLFRRADIPLIGRGDAAAATWKLRGDRRAPQVWRARLDGARFSDSRLLRQDLSRRGRRALLGARGENEGRPRVRDRRQRPHGSQLALQEENLLLEPVRLPNSGPTRVIRPRNRHALRRPLRFTIPN